MNFTTSVHRLVRCHRQERHSVAARLRDTHQLPQRRFPEAVRGRATRSIVKSDLVAPDGNAHAQEPPSYPVPTITSQAIGKGVWRVNQGGTTIIEFRDHIVLFELGVNVASCEGRDRARPHTGAGQSRSRI